MCDFFSFSPDWLRAWTNRKAKKCKTDAIRDLFGHSIKLALKTKHILNISEFIHSAISCATYGEVEDADLLVFSRVHSRSEKLKFIRSLSSIEGLRQSRLQRAIRDTLK